MPGAAPGPAAPGPLGPGEVRSRGLDRGAGRVGLAVEHGGEQRAQLADLREQVLDVLPVLPLAGGERLAGAALVAPGDGREPGRHRVAPPPPVPNAPRATRPF